MKKQTKVMWNVGLIGGLLLLLFVLEQILPSGSMLFTVLKKGAIYALVAVSMNLLNGFTGLFSLGQAGFMLLGAYTYGILTIPVESRASVYQYFNGGIVQFAIPVPLALIAGGIVAAIFAYLIGCRSSVVCNYIDNNLYTILMGLITHCLKFITSTELIITDFEISRLIVIVPLSVAVKIHTAVFALKTLVNRRCLHSRKTCCGNIPH